MQFFASWMLLCAIIRKESEFNTDHKILLGFLLASYVLTSAFNVVNGFSQSISHWLAITLPAIFTVLAILWKIRHTEIAALSGKILLILSGISLASIRIALLIVDNSVDIILTVSNAGLLLSWNKRAENVFGYTSVQTIKKMYIDELFSGNYWHKNVDQEKALSATMERIDGKTFPVKARMKTIIDDSGTHTIYVTRDGELES